MKLNKSLNNKGFTLLETVIVISIIGVISFFALGITSSMKAASKLTVTKSNMEIIAKKARDFYRGHGDLPKASEDSGTVPATDDDPPLTGNMVPVDAKTFDLEPKYRLDAWGRYLLYFTYTNDGEGNRPGEIAIDTPGGGGSLVSFHPTSGSDRTLIKGVKFSGNRVAGIIISSGPDQVFNYSATEEPSSDNHNEYFKTYTLDPGSDDIIVLIDVSQEAFEIANNDLLFLNQKVNAYNAMYEGIDNNNDGQVDGWVDLNGDSIKDEDEYGCIAIKAPLGDSKIYCPLPISSSLPNDPNCGTATLDAIKANVYGPFTKTCSTLPTECGWEFLNVFPPYGDEIKADEARAFIFCLYNLQCDQVVDPWLNGYVWGYGSSLPSPLTSTITKYEKSDKRFHRFYSAGPNAEVGDDDDITTP